MYVSHSRQPALPPLAWVARIEPSGPVHVIVGTDVDVQDSDPSGPAPGYWCEGAWLGDFGLMRPEDHPSGCVTGGRVDERGLVLWTHNHTNERVWTLRQPQCLWASNSLPLILAASGEALDDRVRSYAYTLQSIMRGIGHWDPHLPLARRAGGAAVVTYHMMHTLHVAPDLSVREVPHPLEDAPRDFPHYRAMLQSTMDALVRNARDPRRRRPLDLVATLSAGYDSPACAALAKDAGCRRAVTIRTGLHKVGPQRKQAADDDGSAIGACLGMDVHAIDRDDYRRLPDCPEALNLCSGEIQEAVLVPAAKHLRGSLIVMGAYGDAVWGPRRPDPALSRVSINNATMTEHRLRWGSVLVCPCYFGARHWPALRALSDHPSMDPWRVGPPGYVRPLARRIIEEAGVPRGLFAVHKAATTVSWEHVRTRAGLQASMTPGGWRELEAFRAARLRTAPWMPPLWALRDRLDRRRFQRARAAWNRLHALDPAAPRRPIEALYRPFAFIRGGLEGAVHWAIDRTRDDYARALATPPAPASPSAPPPRAPVVVRSDHAHPALQ